MTDDLRTPENWCELLDARILDPDGWRGPDGRDWNDPIDRKEFDRRYKRCTVDLRRYDPFNTLRRK